MTAERMETFMSWLLLIGIGLAVLLTLAGGLVYLIQFGFDPLPLKTLQNEGIPIRLSEIWQQAAAFAPMGLIELGLLVLVATQSARVGLLAIYFRLVEDYRFTMISAFLFIILLYSLSLA